MEQGKRRCIYQRGCAERRRGGAIERGRGGDCAPIHTGGIWLEKESGGLEKFPSGGLVRNGAKHPGAGTQLTDGAEAG